MVFAAASVAAAPQLAAQTLYREDFVNQDAMPLTALGWADTYFGVVEEVAAAANTVADGGAFGAAGTHWWWSNNPLADPVNRVTGASITLPGEVPAIDSSTPDLTISWEHRLENMQDNDFNQGVSGIPWEIKLALEVGGSWYVSADTYLTGETGVGGGGAYTPVSVDFDADASNWLTMTLDPLTAEDPVGGVMIGGAPASDLSGDITGVGWAATFSQYSTVNFNFVEIGVPPIPGDVNGDMEVTTVDFDLILANFNATGATRGMGDLTGDATVDLFDFDQWKENYVALGALASDVAVPEPCSLALLLLGGLGCAARRARR